MKRVSLTAIALLLAGCIPPEPAPPTPDAPPDDDVVESTLLITTEREETPDTARHVIVMVWDGVRPDVLQEVDTPHIDRLVQEGTYTWNAWTTWRPITRTALPSLHTGAPPSVHGMDEWAGPIHAETIAEVLAEAGLTSGLAGADPVLGGDAATHVTGYYPHTDSAAHFVDRAIIWIDEHRPNFLYVYNPEPDGAGHNHGHWSEEYRAAIAKADSQLGRLIEHLEDQELLDQTVLIITTDHGMTGRAHGYGHETDMRIFSVWRGPNIRAGHEMEDRIDIPARAAGEVIVQLYEIQDRTWSEEAITWETQPATGRFVTETRVDDTDVFSWDITSLAQRTLQESETTGQTVLSFALLSPHGGEGPPPPEETDAFNPTLYSEINRAVYFNTIEWYDSGVHPALHVVYHTAEGEKAEFRIAPEETAMILAGKPAKNHANRENFHIGYAGDGEARAFFKFDLETNLPNGAAIESASFQATCWRQFPGGHPEVRVAHRMIDIAPTITHLLDVRAPRDATGSLIEEVLAE